MYMCYFTVAPADEDAVGAVPQRVAQSLVDDVINQNGPTMCTQNPAEPFCYGIEGVTQACGVHPVQATYFCTVPRPPNPIRTPLVWVQEAERCDPAFRLSNESAKALVDMVTPLVPGLVVTMYDFECLSAQGGAFWQFTYQIAAGASLDIFTGSRRIVDWLQANRTTLCTAPLPAERPVFCRDPPLGGQQVCAINQFDPANVFICPLAPGNLALTFALGGGCSCAASPRDSAADTANILEWMDFITLKYLKINVANSVREYKCEQASADTCQYEYRVRTVPLDDRVDGSAAIQYIRAEVNVNPQPCSDASGYSFAFCKDAGAVWRNATACAEVWDRGAPLQCSLLPNP
jgi:hypothetical protein